MPEATAHRSRRWRPSIQVYLLGLLALVALVIGAIIAYEREQNLDDVRAETRERVRFQASLAAGDITAALDATQRIVTQVAATPGLAAILEAPGAAAARCELAFAGAGPFRTGHIDVVSREGRVVCSSREPPPGTPYAGAAWLEAERPGPTVTGPVTDAATGDAAVVVRAGLDDGGVAAAFLDVRAAEERLSEVFTGPLGTDFALVESTARIADQGPAGDRIIGTADVPLLGWTVVASADESRALAGAERLNRQLLLLMIVGFLLLVAVTYLLYRGLARPIEQLSASVRRATAGRPPPALTISGPAEVATLAEDYARLQRDVVAELARRREAEARLRASEESYRTLFEANPLPMWVYDVQTLAFLDVNDSAVAIYGYSRDEFLAMTILDIRPKADRAAVAESAQDPSPLQRSGPWRHQRKEGGLVEVEITSHIVEFAGREARFVMAEDVTQRERARRLLQQAERMESLGQLAGGVAHDFNNVLAVMLNYADFASEEVAAAAATDPERWQPVLHDLEQVSVAGGRAAALTQQLLSFARGDTGETRPVVLNDVVTGIEDMLRRTIGDRIQLHVSLAPGLWRVNGNTSQLEQVLLNLAVNARDAMPEGGQLSIETTNVEVDEHHAAARPELAIGRYVRLRVSDTGQGMDEEALDHAFEPFFTTKERGKGTGLGLATVYGIVTRADGTVHIYSEPGMGTAVSIMLPATNSAGEGAPRAVERPAFTAHETVLIVEDDEGVRELAARILMEQGYEVCCAADASAAIELVDQRHEPIDLVLSDVVMPGMLGGELALRLRALVPGIRVLFMSGYAPPQLARSGSLPAGAPLIDKPFSGDALVARVRATLQAPPASLGDEPHGAGTQDRPG